MSPRNKLIYELVDLEKEYNGRTVLNIKSLKIHPGTVYGIIGSIGSGKSTLLRLLAGLEKQSSGSLNFDNEPFETNWFGKIKKRSDIYLANVKLLSKNLSTKQIISKKYPKYTDKIKNTYFAKKGLTHIWNTPIRSLSPGESALVYHVVALESDPRVLLIDDYGTHIDNDAEFAIRKQLQKMNKELGTTVILSSSTDQRLRKFSAVQVFIDNGHVAKIRSGSTRKPPQQNRKRR